MVESHRQEIAKLEALYAGNPGGRVFVHLAEALRKGGEHDRARSILAEGLARHPDSASGYVVLGRVLIDQGENREAESAFQTVLELDGGNLVALRCLGDLALTDGRSAEAIGHYRELLARNPASEDVAAAVWELERAASRSGASAAGAEDASPADDAAFETAEPTAGERSPEVAASSDTADPGRTGSAYAPVPEFGEIDASDLPGDLAAFAGLVREPEPAAETVEPGARPLDADMLALLESTAAPIDVDELDSDVAEVDSDVAEVDSDVAEVDSDAAEDGSDVADVENDVATTAVEEPSAMQPVELASAIQEAEPIELPADAQSGAAAAERDPVSFEIDLVAMQASDEEMEPAALDLSDLVTPPEILEEEPLDLAGLAPRAADIEAAPLGIGDLMETDSAAVEPWPASESAGSDSADSADVAEPVEVEAATDTASHDVVTETMADLYLAQGFADRAADVYRALLHDRPDDAGLAAKLEQAMLGTGADAVADEQPDEWGDVWSSGVEAAATGGETTPYTWTEREERDEGVGIAAYLRGLLAWGIGDAVRPTETVPETAVAEPAPAAEAPPAGDADEPMPWDVDTGDDWLEPEPESWSDSAAESEPAFEAGSADEDVAPAEPWSVTAEPLLEAEWGGASDDVAPWSGQVEPPADPWLAREPDAVAEEPAASRRTGLSPVEEAFYEWFDAPPAEPAGPAQAPAEAVESVAPVSPVYMDEAEPAAADSVTDPVLDEDEDDEDLEMFRSWLQSLKK